MAAVIYDLYAHPPGDGAENAPPDRLAAPPTLLWGIAWRLLTVELLALLLAGDILPWMPPATLPLSLAAIAAWGLPLQLWRRRQLGGAVWRVLAAGALLALCLGRPVALVGGLAGAFGLCLGEPVVLLVHRHRAAARPASAAAEVATEATPG